VGYFARHAEQRCAALSTVEVKMIAVIDKADVIEKILTHTSAGLYSALEYG